MLQSRVPSTCVPVPSRSLIHQINQGKRRDSFNAIENAKAAGHVKRQSPYKTSVALVCQLNMYESQRYYLILILGKRDEAALQAMLIQIHAIASSCGSVHAVLQCLFH